MLNQILNRLTSSGTAQGRRATTTRGRGGGTGVRRGVRGRGSRQQATAQTLVGRLLRRR